MSQSDYYSQNSDGLKDKVSNAADAVQQASVDAYELVRDTAQEQPFVSGMLVGRSGRICARCPVEVRIAEVSPRPHA